jgi:kynurenine formamidase
MSKKTYQRRLGEQDTMSTEAHLKVKVQKQIIIFTMSKKQNQTGWSERDIMNTEAYLNGGNFPGFSPEAAKWLLEKDIVGIGIDTPSVDPGTHQGGDLPIHKVINTIINPKL